MEKRDRLTAAWELRRDIHAWLKINIGAQMDEIIRAFPGIKRDTLRNCIAKMRKDKDVVMVKEPANVGRYSAVTRDIVPLEVTRAKMSAVGKKSVLIAQAAHCANAARRKAERAARKAEKAEQKVKAEKPARVYPGPQIDPERPWVTTHSEGGTAPARDSRGQGAVVPKVSVNCFQLY